MQWLLQNVISPLLLPVFIILLLCAMAGVKGEAILKMLIDALIAVVGLLVPVLSMFIKLLARTAYELLRLLAWTIAASLRLLTGKDCQPCYPSKFPGKEHQPGSKPKAPGKSKYPPSGSGTGKTKGTSAHEGWDQ